MDREIDQEVLDILEKYGDQRVDFRPYMNDTPTTVLTTDSIEYCVRVFRSMALRHMCVLLPSNGKLAGIITREDLFRWMDL
jgi:CBS domain-containing protein|tara:strand:+ start:2699 stop:2941 length:243 start_codon:yes stop_codon:yes gene_type:complete